MGRTRLLIGDLAAQVGLAPSALRYYEAAGLLEAEARTGAGYRVYGRRAAYRARFIKRARSLGLKLSEIKQLVDSPRGTRQSEREVFDRVIESKVQDTRSRIASMRAMERQLRGLGSALDSQPPPEQCHLGDCSCWLPA